MSEKIRGQVWEAIKCDAQVLCSPGLYWHTEHIDPARGAHKHIKAVHEQNIPEDTLS